jgi:predicted metalloprotease
MIQQFLGAAQQNMTQETSVVDTPKNARADDELAAFVKVVLADTEDVWTKLFREQMGKNYQKPVLVLYEGKVNSACGFASSATGPFYCPGDQKLYIDLSFYSDLKNKFGAPGDFAMAYVVAHEVAHHVQYLLGITRQVDSQRGKVSKTVYNDLSVRLELQADFFSGVWANHAQKMNDILEEGDIEEALNAARAIGDDRLQMQSRGYVVPESFTHGTSEQRMRWFTKGFKTGDPNQGDTFQTKNL